MDDTRKKFLEELNKKRKEFEEALSRLIENQKAYNGHLYGDQFTDESDHAQREISTASNYSLIERKTKELKQIDRLIQKLSKNENYGICEECGRPIPPARLLIVPETCLCVDCQRELEKLDYLKSLGEKCSHDFGPRIEKEFEMIGTDDEDQDYDIIEADMDLLPLMDSDLPEENGQEKID